MFFGTVSINYVAKETSFKYKLNFKSNCPLSGP